PGIDIVRFVGGGGEEKTVGIDAVAGGSRIIYGAGITACNQAEQSRSSARGRETGRARAGVAGHGTGVQRRNLGWCEIRNAIRVGRESFGADASRIAIDVAEFTGPELWRGNGT